MKTVRSVLTRPCLPLMVFLIAPVLAPPNVTRAASAPGLEHRFISKGEELLMELWSQGKLGNTALARAIAARHAAHVEEDELEMSETPTFSPWIGPGSQALGPDAIANDRSLSSCLCAVGNVGRPLDQNEPSVAAFGPYVVASWNDRRGACSGQTGGTRQAYAYSSDHGATFHEPVQLLSTINNISLRGDPTVAVNAKTGNWYISGLAGAGVGIVRGHFTETGFDIDARQHIQAQPNEGTDKPWMAVDSTSGNVYVTWTNFPADLASRILLQRFDADLNPLGPIQELRFTPAGANYACQLSYPAVGPDGVLYVAWDIYYFNPITNDLSLPVSHYEIVRSDDYGQTFGPIQKIADHSWNITALSPGNPRGIWAGVIALAIDNTHGPHRGRVYASWATLPFLPDPVPTGPTVQEVENNDFFASAMPITPGGRVHGNTGVGQTDFFKFTGQRGQVLRIWPDTLNNQRLRIICPADTSTFANYHFIALNQYQYICGLAYDGTYYIQVASVGSSGGYQIATVVDQAPPGDPARDIRDPFLTWSDDGVSWGTPVRLNDDDPGSDCTHVQVSVDGRGRVHCFWFDWREDLVCGVISNQYMASSGDGGVTWGANRKVTDAPSFWGVFANCTPNPQGDYTHMAAAGDYVYSAFNDARLGDADIWVDASRFTSVAACPGNIQRPPKSSATLDLSLVNQGNFDTPLAWRVTDSRGWLTGATPSLEGSQTLAADGGVQVVQASLFLPTGCDEESTLVRFITSDPHIPGYQDTCVTVVRCTDVTPVQVALIDAVVRNGTVTLRWHGALSAGRTAFVSRRAALGAWVERGAVTADGSGIILFEDRDVPPGRYVYRLTSGADDAFPIETSVEVPALGFALHGALADPRGVGVRVTFQLASSERATLQLADVAGRIIEAREVGTLGPGSHDVTLAARRLPAGLYLVRLRQGESSAARKAVLLR